VRRRSRAEVRHLVPGWTETELGPERSVVATSLVLSCARDEAIDFALRASDSARWSLRAV